MTVSATNTNYIDFENRFNIDKSCVIEKHGQKFCRIRLQMLPAFSVAYYQILKKKATFSSLCQERCRLLVEKSFAGGRQITATQLPQPSNRNRSGSRSRQMMMALAHFSR